MWNFISWFDAPDMHGFPKDFVAHFPHVAAHNRMMHALPSIQSYLAARSK
jgi:hypothetical protein